MDWKDIDRLRDPGFTEARRGYDRREVDRFLGSLVDWLETDAATELGDLTVQRKLEHVGKSTGRILLVAEEEAEKLRRITDQESADLRAEAEAAAHKTREAADRYAHDVRAKADADANQMIEEGERRRAEIDAVVSELEARRDSTIKDLDRLRTELASAIGPHEPAPPKAEPAPPKAEPAPPKAEPARKKQSGAAVKA
jgi:DivIVA domain-containing protein